MNKFVKNDSEKVRFDLLPHTAERRIAEVLTFGAAKYSDGGWRKVDDRGRYYAALRRHLDEYWRGEDRDPESGLPHLAHAGASLMFLLEADELGLGKGRRNT